MVEMQPTFHQSGSERAEPAPTRRGRFAWWSVVVAVWFTLIVWCIWRVPIARQSARQQLCECNLRLIWLALRSYADFNGCYPAVRTLDDHGRALQSWRVILMPYLGSYSFAEHYTLPEPWNSPTNRMWTDLKISRFVCPCSRRTGTNFTNYVAVVGPETVWGADQPTNPDEITNVEAIFVVEYPDSDIPWGEPRDLTEEEFLAMLEERWARKDFGPHPRGLLYVTVSSEIRAIGSNTSVEMLRRLLRARTPK